MKQQKYVIITTIIILVLTCLSKSRRIRTFKEMLFNETIFDEPENYHKNIGICYAFANSTHRFGCYSDQIKSFGNAVHVQTIDELNDIHMAQDDSSFVAVINIYNLNAIHNLFEHRKELMHHLKGIIFYKNESEFQALLDNIDDCPNLVSSYNRFQKADIKPRSLKTNKTIHFINDTDHEKHHSSDKISRYSASEPERLVEKDIFENSSAWADFTNHKFISEQWPFPIVFLHNDTKTVDNVLQCCSLKDCFIEFESTGNNVIRNSKECLSKTESTLQYFLLNDYPCVELEAINIVGNLVPVPNYINVRKKSIIMVTARLDSFTLFQNYQPGTNTVYSAIPVMLLVAEYLMVHYTAFINMRPNHTQIDNVIFALFDGESRDFLGSSSWIYSSSFFQRDNESPFLGFDLSQIHTVIELSHFLNSPNISLYTGDDREDFIKNASDFLNHSTIHFGEGLPPKSTVQNLYQMSPGSFHTLFVTSSRQNEYGFYHHTVWDTPQQKHQDIDIGIFLKTAEGLAKFILSQMKVPFRKGPIFNNSRKVEILYDCFIRYGNASCFQDDKNQTFRKYLNETILNDLNLVNTGPIMADYILRAGMGFRSERYSHKHMFNTKNFIHWYMMTALQQSNECLLPKGSPSMKLSFLYNTISFCVYSQVIYDEVSSPFLEAIIFKRRDAKHFLEKHSNFRYSTFSEINYINYMSIKTYKINSLFQSKTFLLVLVTVGLVATIIPVFVISLFFSNESNMDVMMGKETEIDYDPKTHLMSINECFFKERKLVDSEPQNKLWKGSLKTSAEFLSKIMFPNKKVRSNFDETVKTESIRSTNKSNPLKLSPSKRSICTISKILFPTKRTPPLFMYKDPEKDMVIKTRKFRTKLNKSIRLFVRSEDMDRS